MRDRPAEASALIAPVRTTVIVVVDIIIIIGIVVVGVIIIVRVGVEVDGRIKTTPAPSVAAISAMPAMTTEVADKMAASKPAVSTETVATKSVAAEPMAVMSGFSRG